MVKSHLQIAKTFFTIHSPTPIRDMKMYDVLGKLVRTENFIEFKSEKTIPLEEIGAGVYFLRIKAGETECIRTVIITK